MKRTSLLGRFLALPAATRWQVTRPVLGTVAAFVVLVAGIRWYRINYLPVADLTASIPDANKYGHVDDALRRSRALLAALEKVDYNPFKVPLDLQHLPDESMSESKAMFGESKETSCYAFPGLASDSEMREATKEIAFSTDLYVRHNPQAYKDDVVKTHAAGFVIVGWKNGQVTTVPVEDVRLAVFTHSHGFTEVYPGMKAYNPNGLHIPAIEFPDGKITPKFQAFLKQTLATDDTQACRAKTK